MMRRVRYAGGEFLTTDEIASVLLRLAWGVSVNGGAEIVEVPIAVPGPPASREVAQLIINASSEFLSLPAPWDEEEPDFSGEAMMLQMLPAYPRTVAAAVPATPTPPPQDGWDPEFGDW